MSFALRRRRTTAPENGLSLFLAVYLCGFVGVLLGVHVLQPERADPASAPNPSVQQEPSANKGASADRAGHRGMTGDGDAVRAGPTPG